MSKVRSFLDLSSFGTFGNAIRCLLSTGQSKCSRKRLHIVFDSYLESSVKSGERTRGTTGITAVDMTHIGSGERRRHLPLHILAQKLGHEMCKVLLKLHVLSGDDAHSRSEQSMQHSRVSRRNI